MSKKRSMLYIFSAALLLAVVSNSYGTRWNRVLVNGAQSPKVSKAVKTTSGAGSGRVQELDAAGLKKVLKRDASSTQPLLVTFWATWCEPCRQEFPDLVKIDNDYKSKGLEFVTVSLDDPGDINKSVPEYLRGMHAAMPAYLLNVSDPDTIIAAVDSKWDGGLPATFLYDAKGEVVFRHVGRIQPAELRVAIDQQLQSKVGQGR